MDSTQFKVSIILKYKISSFWLSYKEKHINYSTKSIHEDQHTKRIENENTDATVKFCKLLALPI